MKSKRAGFGIIGVGRFGFALAKTLSEAGRDVIAVDENEDSIRKIRDYVDEAYIVGALTDEALEETGISECETVVICIAKIEVSVLTTQRVLEFGVPRVLAKADSLEHGVILDKIGAEAIYPEMETAVRLAGVLMGSQAMDLMQLNDDYVISEIRFREGQRDKTIGGLNFDKYNVRLIAIEVQETGIILDATDETIVSEGDAIVVGGKFKDVEKFEENEIHNIK